MTSHLVISPHALALQIALKIDEQAWAVQLVCGEVYAAFNRVEKAMYAFAFFFFLVELLIAGTHFVARLFFGQPLKAPVVRHGYVIPRHFLLV